MIGSRLVAGTALSPTRSMLDALAADFPLGLNRLDGRGRQLTVLMQDRSQRTLDADRLIVLLVLHHAGNLPHRGKARGVQANLVARLDPGFALDRVVHRHRVFELEPAHFAVGPQVDLHVAVAAVAQVFVVRPRPANARRRHGETLVIGIGTPVSTMHSLGMFWLRFRGVGQLFVTGPADERGLAGRLRNAHLARGHRAARAEHDHEHAAAKRRRAGHVDLIRRVAFIVRHVLHRSATGTGIDAPPGAPAAGAYPHRARLARPIAPHRDAT